MRFSAAFYPLAAQIIALMLVGLVVEDRLQPEGRGDDAPLFQFLLWIAVAGALVGAAAASATVGAGQGTAYTDGCVVAGLALPAFYLVRRFEPATVVGRTIYFVATGLAISAVAAAAGVF